MLPATSEPPSRPTELYHVQELLVLMLLDVEEESNGTFNLWGLTSQHDTVLVRVADYQPYFYIPQPDAFDPSTQSAVEFDDTAQQRLLHALNVRLPMECKIDRIERVHTRPIMWYRPSTPDGQPFLRLLLRPGGNVKKASSLLAGLAKDRAFQSSSTCLVAAEDAHETETKLLMRFLVDASLAGTSWLLIPGAQHPAARLGGGFAAVPEQQRRSRCALELSAPWRALHSLTPDATQLAAHDWQPEVLRALPPPELGLTPDSQAALQLAREGAILPLRVATLDVQMAPCDGAARCTSPARDGVAAIAVALHSQDAGDAVRSRVVFVVAAELARVAGGRLEAEGAVIRAFATERDMLLAWLAWLHEADPDVLAVYQARDTLGALVTRFERLRLDGGGLHASRLRRQHSRPLGVKSVVQYTAAWVKSQARMASTSNQETFRVEETEGRLVFDVLRQVLTSQGLASFSLVDCVMTLLGEPLEIIPPQQLAQLVGQMQHQRPQDAARRWQGGSAATGAVHGLTAAQAAVRLARYGLRRVDLVRRLMLRLATIPETFEMARVTGLTVDQILYNAQMIRTWSLLHRNAHRHRYIIGGKVDPVTLIESPHLLHPIEQQTAGLYKAPVALLDFASLYPSLYRAHNLCYTTLVEGVEDLRAIGEDNCIRTPSNHVFVKPHVRQGILPAILAALMSARASTRDALKRAKTPSAKAVLDGRQKALKLTANALYGFTGAQASPLQCVPLADSCLALGAASCREAIALIQHHTDAGAFHPDGRGAKVIYAQTDSVFVHFPNATPAQAMRLGKQAAALVNRSFPSPVELKFERVMAPFVLLHVNRYAGRSFDSEEAAESGRGSLLVKGVKSMWRQAAPFVRQVLQVSLEKILMEDDVAGAVGFVEDEVRRLLSGRVEIWELIMTGGLWRVTGQQLERAAAGNDAVGAPDEEVRGPHASLAVRLTQRDPDRKFVLGERLSYVLLAGARLQDEAAEDPLTAAQQGLQPNYELYWHNKLQVPLQELFSTCLTPQALQALMNGPHTMLRVEQLAPSEAPAGFGLHSAPVTPSKKGPRQAGLSAFFKQSVRCLFCKQVLQQHELGRAATDPSAVVSALCSNCRADPDRLPAVLIATMADDCAQDSLLCSSVARCQRCHSGGQQGAVVCENGECPVLFERLGSWRRLMALQQRLARVDAAADW